MASDIVLPSTSDLGEVSESALKGALPWDVVPSRRYGRLDRVEPYLAVLRENSRRRVAADDGFHELEDDVARLKTRLATKSISLNEAERRQELAKAKARQREYERARRSLQGTRPPMYEITLENAASPGLPAPSATKRPEKAPAASTEEGDDAPADGSFGEDIILDESERILADYVDLLGKRSASSAVHAGSAPATSAI